MREDLIIIKYGGGLITSKAKLCEANYHHINGLAQVIKKLKSEFHIIIVHGAGSFGHLKAKEAKLHLGLLKEMENEQRLAINQVRNDMKNLCEIIFKSLDDSKVQIHHPHELGFKGTNSEFEGNVQNFFCNDNIQIIHGDVVEVENESFGILSGDDICVKLAKEASAKSRYRNIHMIFAMTGASGVMTLPPDEKGSELIKEWRLGDEMKGLFHNSDIDVTGGIRLKLTSAAKIAENNPNCNIWILDGRQPQRIIEAVTNKNTIGTKIVT